jgi:hypothetical protein
VAGKASLRLIFLLCADGGLFSANQLRGGISLEMAMRLSQVLGGSAQSWITQQAHYDLAQIPAGRILGLPPWLAQTVKTHIAVRCKNLDRQDHCTAF